MKKFMVWAFVAILSGVGVLCACTLSSTAAEIELPEVEYDKGYIV